MTGTHWKGPLVPSFETLALFLFAVLLFAVAPGPAVFYVVTRSLSQGRRPGITSAMAVASGNLVHVAAAVVGLSTLLASSAIAFTVIKYLGAAYLIYLGVRTLLCRGDERADLGFQPAVALSRVYRQGFMVAVLNPKTALFFLAFLPQFVDPAGAPVPVQVGLLGLLLVVITALSDCGYALVTGTAESWIRRNSHVQRAWQLVSGGTYITLGVAAALTGDRPATVT